jgi:hypothetical protein
MLRRSRHAIGGAGAAAGLALLAVGAARWRLGRSRMAAARWSCLLPDQAPGDALDVARAADARILWVDPAGRLMAVAIDEEARDRLYSAGAWLVTRSPALAGCAASLKVA